MLMVEITPIPLTSGASFALGCFFFPGLVSLVFRLVLAFVSFAIRYPSLDSGNSQYSFNHALHPHPHPHECTSLLFQRGCSSLGYNLQPSTKCAPFLSLFFLACTALAIILASSRFA